MTSRMDRFARWKPFYPSAVSPRLARQGRAAQSDGIKPSPRSRRTTDMSEIKYGAGHSEMLSTDTTGKRIPSRCFVSASPHCRRRRSPHPGSVVVLMCAPLPEHCAAFREAQAQQPRHASTRRGPFRNLRHAT